MIQKLLRSMMAKSHFGKRLDRALVELFPDYSRSCIKEWILNDRVQINGNVINKPKEKVLGNETIMIDALIDEELRWEAEDNKLDIIYEDQDILVINKPFNLVVHPGVGNPNGTLLNRLLHYFPTVAGVPRAGIVHRLDKDTTGLMVIAKTLLAQARLMKLLQARAITREYEAVVVGSMITSGTINEPICRHPIKRTYMSVHPMGKPAVTHYRITDHFRSYTHLRLRLETGRMHQIRVHMMHVNHPLLGDQLYGGRLCLPKGASEELVTALRAFDRQALHATMLRLYHPISGIEMEWHASLPKDMADLVKILKADKESFKDKHN
ncbi:MAG: 23S rRNA pseudouridine(1911/1915/1917) synthase RluD [Candidatus Malihini olakiniferum]